MPPTPTQTPPSYLQTLPTAYSASTAKPPICVLPRLTPPPTPPHPRPTNPSPFPPSPPYSLQLPPAHHFCKLLTHLLMAACNASASAGIFTRSTKWLGLAQGAEVDSEE